MSNETHQAIAMEAAEVIREKYNIAGYAFILPIILAAIEKSRGQWEVEYRARLRDSWRVQEAVQPQRSEFWDNPSREQLTEREKSK
jgi:hypothetical protein